MLSSIHPLGERGRGQRWSITVTAYVVASLVAGAAVGAGAGTAGAALPVHGRALLIAAAGACAIAAVADARGARVPWVHRQVDERWLQSYRGWAYGAGYGAQLGAAVTTTITTAMVPLFLALALFTGSPGSGALVGATFGSVRAVPVLLLRHVHHPPQLWRLHARMARLAPHSARSAVATAAVLAGVLAARAA